MTRYYTTVATGLEFLAEEELRERYAPENVERERGKLFFTTHQPGPELLQLRAADNLYAFVGRAKGVPADESGLTFLRDVPLQVDWEPPLKAWRAVYPTAPNPPAFRVTAHRVGVHAYQSPDVAAAIGAGVVRRFGWPVNLTRYDLEVHAQLKDDELFLGVTLSLESLYRRERAVLGRTALKPSIAYCMARLARIQPGEVVVDPMCGVGTIPVEAAQVWPGAHYWAGDVAPIAVERTAMNIAQTHVNVHLLQWDACALPLPTDCVNAVVSDLPFGRRMGSHDQNKRLYPRLLKEMARVLGPGGRAVLLTLEKGIMRRLLEGNKRWECESLHVINVGGLDPALFLLRKT